MRLGFALVVVSTVIFGFGRQVGAQCIEAEQDEFAEGNLKQHVFTDAAGRPEPAFILNLPAPICLAGSDDLDNVENANTIQVFSSDERIDEAIGSLVGRSVLVRGKAFGALTVHHHAPIIMDVSEIRTFATQSSVAQRIMQPMRGSTLRAELLDAARPIFEDESGGPVEFVVKRLNVLGDWAFGEVRLQRPGGEPIAWENTRYAEAYEAGMFDPASSFFLLQRIDIDWVVQEFATGPTDVTWDGWRQAYSLPLALFER